MRSYFVRNLSITVFFAVSATVVWADQGTSGLPGIGVEQPSHETLEPGPLDMTYHPGSASLSGGSGTPHRGLLDDYKNIPLDEDWTLSLGGQFRYRFESETNKAFGATEPAHDSFHLFRYLINADFKYRDTFRIYFELISAFDEDRELAPRPIDENQWDIQQLFIDTYVNFLGQPWTVRVGRQGLIYGNQRLISTFDWANVQRHFDGAKIFTSNDTWDLDIWWAKPVVPQRQQHDRVNEDVQFWGAYATYKGIKNHGLDLYFLGLVDSGSSVNPNGSLRGGGDRKIYTLGSRFWGTTGPWDYETELAGQWGHWSSDDVQAWSWSIDGGYTFDKASYRPRIGAGFDIATGDRDPNDGNVQTFTQLFPLSHKYFGFLDLIGRQNITAANVNLSAWAVPDKVRGTMTLHGFWLTSDKDSLFAASGAPALRDPAGNSGREVGYELDTTVNWKLDDASNMLFGWSHLWDQGFLQNTTPGESADLFYIQYVYNF